MPRRWSRATATARRRPRPRAARLYLAAAGRRPAPGVARRRQHLGQDRAARPARRAGRGAVRQGQRLGHGGDRAGRACPPCASRRCANCAEREALSDEEMVRVQRANLLDPGAPNPSVETLLHAFLPHKFIDHTHCDGGAEPRRPARCRRALRRALRAADGARALHHAGLPARQEGGGSLRGRPAVEGLVLLKHGVFTFGDTAREAYERMIAVVTLGRGAARARPQERCSPPRALPRAIAARPRSRRSCAAPARSPIRPAPGSTSASCSISAAARRCSNFVNGAELARYGRAGVATPDHTIRTKNYPLIVPAPEAGRLDGFAAAAREAVERFAAEYHAYFARHNAARRRRSASSTRCRGSSWCRGSACSGSGAAPRTPRSPPISPNPGSRP